MIKKLLPQLKLFFIFISGIFVGFSLSQLMTDANHLNSSTGSGISIDSISGRDNALMLSKNSRNDATIIDLMRNTATTINDQETREASAQNPIKIDDPTLARYLYNETRVLCWILTGPSNHEKRALHVKSTWGSRCNKLIFMSSKTDKKLGAIKLPSVGEGRAKLWSKTREAMKYIYQNHIDDADWFLKADDDTYVIMENLRAFLYPFDTNAPVYFGCKFKPLVRQGYMSGGAGYVLSKEALIRFVERAYPNNKICRTAGGSEDKEMGNCLQNVGVVAGDSRDELKRGRFFPTGPQGHLIPKPKNSWYWRYIYYATTDGLSCCSDYAISFHYVQPLHFYVMDYLIYQLRAFGIRLKTQELPEKLNMTVLIEKWRHEKSDNPLAV